MLWIFLRKIKPFINGTIVNIPYDNAVLLLLIFISSCLRNVVGKYIIIMANLSLKMRKF
jgi:hypothetical protein